MNYGELRDYIQGVLNRDDCTDTLTDQFIGLALLRAQRQLKTSFQRDLHVETIDGTWTGSLELPADFLGTYHLDVGGAPVRRLTLAQETEEGLEGYRIRAGSIYFSRDLLEGEVITLDYYTLFDKTPAVSDVTNYTDGMEDAIIYGALFYAAEYFVDVRKPDFLATFSQYLDEIQSAASLEETSGGLVMTPYGGGVA